MNPNHDAPADLWPLDLPDPGTLVHSPPWDSWREPGGARGSVEDRLGTWFFDLGMILWEIQVGYHPPEDVEYFLPPARWADLALVWIRGALAPRPQRGHRLQAAWERRQAGLASLLSDLRARCTGAVS